MASTTMNRPSPSSSTALSPEQVRPLKTIPGSYGWPLLGAFSDRLNYFWFQGPEKFFKKRTEKYNSTVFRTNMPPTFPFFHVNPNVIAVLDCQSFAHMFDMEIVEKRDVLIGDFMPSVKYTGNVRACVYLDTTEERHSKLKSFYLNILRRSSKIWATEFISNVDDMWVTLESNLSTSKDSFVNYTIPLKKFLFKFLLKTILGADSESSHEISKSGYQMLDKWLAIQLLPRLEIKVNVVLQPLAEIFLHSFSYPFFLISSDYKKLAEFVDKEACETVERGVNEFGLSKEDVVHNLLFMVGINAYAGFYAFLPNLMSVIGTNPSLQKKLRKEVLDKVGNSELSLESVAKLELVKSVIYETLRMNPPVPLQYARARKDFVLSSHESSFEVKKGELLCGYQKQVMRDPKVFSDPDTFVADRFVGESGQKLLDYLYWSNGPQSGSTSTGNKQCAGKEVIPPTAFLFVARMFQRYESISCDSTSITAINKVD